MLQFETALSVPLFVRLYPHLVTGNYRALTLRKFSLHNVKVSAADAAGVYSDDRADPIHVGYLAQIRRENTLLERGDPRAGEIGDGARYATHTQHLESILPPQTSRQQTSGGPDREQR